MASVVGKTIFSDGKGKLFFGYYKTDDAVEFVDYKTWKKLSFKDVSKGDTNKERVIKAILKNQKQFNKKVDFNMWAKKQKRSFEDTMDWFIQNGWINNINKGGIKESIDVLSVNEAFKPNQVRSAISKVKKELMRKWKQKGGYENFGQKELSQMKDKFDYNPYGTSDERNISKMLDGFDNWAMNYDGNMREGKKRFKRQDGIGKAKYTISYHDGKKKHKDGSDFFDIKIFKNKKDLSDFVGTLVKQGYKLTNESVNESINEAKFGYKDSTASYINKHKDEYKTAEKMNKGNEKKFYDDLQKLEDKIGHPKFMLFISNALRGYKVDMYKDPKIKNPQDAQEALFLLSK